jgi:hypothetical protein
MNFCPNCHSDNVRRSKVIGLDWIMFPLGSAGLSRPRCAGLKRPNKGSSKRLIFLSSVEVINRRSVERPR